jgi:hypothetical protein
MLVLLEQVSGAFRVWMELQRKSVRGSETPERGMPLLTRMLASIQASTSIQASSRGIQWYPRVHMLVENRAPYLAVYLL